MTFLRHSEHSLSSHRLLFLIQSLLVLTAICTFVVLYKFFASATTPVIGAFRAQTDSRHVPDYLQTTATLYEGHTATGVAPFLGQTDPVTFESVSVTPNSPLQTNAAIVGAPVGGNIFHLHGQLSHYASSDGFGVQEYPLPPNANITWVNMLHRHGARYPTDGAGALQFPNKHADLAKKVNFTGSLSFLNDWTYKLGSDILVPIGKQELFDSGTLHYYTYGHLYPNDGTRIIARTTTQNRMLQSAEYFLAGFFGLTWTRNATLELLVESHDGVWNNTLAGYDDCPNSNKPLSFVGTDVKKEWYEIYLANATQRLTALAPGYNWTALDSYNAQSLCAYETVALGYSAFCELFTYDEWLGYEYSIDIEFAGNSGFQSPTSRAVGIGYVQEVLARLEHHSITDATAQVNTTLDGMLSTFPLNQSLYFDFSHDTNIMSILTAFGFKQFDEFLPLTHIIPHELVVSQVTPFAARLDIELIVAPHKVAAFRNSSSIYDATTMETTYIHFILNQRTLPLHRSFGACDYREDGWCELDAFLKTQASSLEDAMYEYSCNGDYGPAPYGTYDNGTPVKKAS